ncbi:MAG: PDZ domain-containing protein [Planctomycetota bacterium]|nr:MAG: PDZ domain-containing protein [Planctomycetota bacterium]
MVRIAVVLLALACAAPTAAQGFGFGKQEPDVVNLGVLGAGVDVQEETLPVRLVLPGGPAAQAGLRVGDVIVGVAGARLQKTADPLAGPVEQVIAAVERAEATKKKPVVVLAVRRGAEEVQVSVRVPYLGKHSRSCPSKCKKCARVVEQGLAFLARTQGPSGEFPTDLGGKTGKVVVTSLGGLAFLSAGVKPGRGGPLDRAARYVLSHVGKEEASPLAGAGGGNWNQVNWELAYGLMFLAEMAHRTGRPEFLQKCHELVTALERTQEASGGWAHGPGGPNALGYVELEIVSNYALLGMAAARGLGVELDAAKLSKALSWIEETSGGTGGVGYSTRPGQKGFGDAGRTAGAIVAFQALGAERHPFFRKMVGFYQGNLRKLPAGHVSPAMHLLAGAMAAHVLGKSAWKTYWKTYRTHVMGVRKPDGSFAPTPTHESRSLRNNTDRTVGPRWTTATYVLILTLHKGNLPALLGGGKGRKKGKKKIRARPRTGSRPRTGARS